METLYKSGDIVQDKYRIVDILGQGGTATTYKAEDLIDNTQVAIKVLSLHQTMEWKIIELFEREAKVLSNLDHPQIPNYIDYFYLDLNNNRVFFLVQELISGKSLADLVKQGWYFQEEEVKDIAQQLLAIIAYLHCLESPVIHRDIKPHNIIRNDMGDIYLVDLGAVQDVYRNTLTYSGTFVGTIDYMSPEQMRGQACFASDLYSLGCTLLYLLTRRSPVDFPLERMKINFRNLLSISPHFADWLEIIIEPALEYRFKSTREATVALKKKSSCKPKIFKSNDSKPVGSKVKLHKTKDKLIIKIHPAIKQNYGVFGYLRFLVPIIFLIVIFWAANFTHSILLEEDFFNAFIPLILFIYIPASIVILCLGYFFKTYDLKIDRDRFIFKCDFLGIKKTCQGRTSSLKWAKTEVRYLQDDESGPAASCCIIKSCYTEYFFGSWLTPVEQEWIISEVTNFIDQVNK